MGRQKRAAVRSAGELTFPSSLLRSFLQFENRGWRKKGGEREADRQEVGRGWFSSLS